MGKKRNVLYYAVSIIYVNEMARKSQMKSCSVKIGKFQPHTLRCRRHSIFKAATLLEWRATFGQDFYLKIASFCAFTLHVYTTEKRKKKKTLNFLQNFRLSFAISQIREVHQNTAGSSSSLRKPKVAIHFVHFYYHMYTYLNAIAWGKTRLMRHFFSHITQ